MYNRIIISPAAMVVVILKALIFFTMTNTKIIVKSIILIQHKYIIRFLYGPVSKHYCFDRICVFHAPTPIETGQMGLRLSMGLVHCQFHSHRP